MTDVARSQQDGAQTDLMKSCSSTGLRRSIAIALELGLPVMALTCRKHQQAGHYALQRNRAASRRRAYQPDLRAAQTSLAVGATGTVRGRPSIVSIRASSANPPVTPQPSQAIASAAVNGHRSDASRDKHSEFWLPLVYGILPRFYSLLTVLHSEDDLPQQQLLQQDSSRRSRRRAPDTSHTKSSGASSATAATTADSSSGSGSAVPNRQPQQPGSSRKNGIAAVAAEAAATEETARGGVIEELAELRRNILAFLTHHPAARLAQQLTERGCDAEGRPVRADDASRGTRLQTLYSGTLPRNWDDYAPQDVLQGRAAIMIGLHGYFAMEAVKNLTSLADSEPKEEEEEQEEEQHTGKAGAAERRHAARAASFAAKVAVVEKEVAELRLRQRYQCHMGDAVLLIDALLQYKGMPAVPYHVMKCLVVILTRLQAGCPYPLDIMTGAVTSPALAVTTSLELLVPLAQMISQHPLMLVTTRIHNSLLTDAACFHFNTTRKALTRLEDEAPRKPPKAAAASATAAAVAPTFTTQNDLRRFVDAYLCCAEVLAKEEERDWRQRAEELKAEDEQTLVTRRLIYCIRKWLHEAMVAVLPWAMGLVPRDCPGAAAAAGMPPRTTTLRFAGGVADAREQRRKMLEAVLLPVVLEGAPQAVVAVGSRAMWFVLEQAAALGDLRLSSSELALSLCLLDMVAAGTLTVPNKACEGGASSSACGSSVAGAVNSVDWGWRSQGVPLPLPPAELRAIDEGAIALRVTTSDGVVEPHADALVGSGAAPGGTATAAGAAASASAAGRERADPQRPPCSSASFPSPCSAVHPSCSSSASTTISSFSSSKCSCLSTTPGSMLEFELQQQQQQQQQQQKKPLNPVRRAPESPEAAALTLLPLTKEQNEWCDQALEVAMAAAAAGGREVRGSRLHNEDGGDEDADRLVKEVGMLTRQLHEQHVALIKVFRREDMQAALLLVAELHAEFQRSGYDLVVLPLLPPKGLEPSSQYEWEKLKFELRRSFCKVVRRDRADGAHAPSLGREAGGVERERTGAEELTATAGGGDATGRGGGRGYGGGGESEEALQAELLEGWRLGRRCGLNRAACVLLGVGAEMVLGSGRDRRDSARKAEWPDYELLEDCLQDQLRSEGQQSADKEGLLVMCGKPGSVAGSMLLLVMVCDKGQGGEMGKPLAAGQREREQEQELKQESVVELWNVVD